MTYPKKAEHPRLYVLVLSSGAHFCDKPNLTPSDKKRVLIEVGRGWDKWGR